MTQRAIIQLCVLVIGVAFEAMGTGWGWANLFPAASLINGDTTESIRGFVYYICEHLKFITLCLLIWLAPPSKNDFKTDGFFLVLAVLDFADYLIFGNQVWFSIGVTPILPISMNVVSIALFCIYANKQWKMNGDGA